MKSLKFIITVLFVGVVGISCSTRPSIVLSEKQMVELLQDMHKADGIFRNDRDLYNTDQQKDALINGVLKKHNVTQKEYDESLKWYADNIDMFTTIQDTVSARLQRKYGKDSDLLAARFKFKLSDFDTELPKHFVLDSSSPTFRFKIDSIKLKEFILNDFRFSFETKGIDTTQHRIEASMYYKYKDTVIIDKRKLEYDSNYEFMKPNIADSLLNELYGYVHMVMATPAMGKVVLNNINNTDAKLILGTDSIKAPEKDMKHDQLKEFSIF